MEVPVPKYDPSKIRNVFALLAAFLIAVELVLAIWLAAAQSSAERIVAGGLATLIFLVFLAIVVVVFFRQSSVREPLSVEGALPSGRIEPAKEVAAPQQIAKPEPDIISGPGGAFDIRKPPSSWKTEVLSSDEYRSKYTGLPAPEGAAFQMADVLDSVLRLASPRTIEVSPDPDHTLVDGVPMFSALTLAAEISLTVAPMERGFPPHFTEYPLNQRLLMQTIPIISIARLQGTGSGKLEGSGRAFDLAQFSQRIENAVIDGVPGRSIEMWTTYIAIEGSVVDHLLLMRSISGFTGASAPTSEDLETLQGLVDSFRPREIVDTKAVEQRRTLRRKEQLEAWRDAVGEGVFYTELEMLAGMYLAGLNVLKPDQCARATSLLAPFRTLATKLGVEAPELTELWTAVDAANNGDPAPLASTLEEIQAEITAQESNGEPDIVEGSAERDAESVSREPAGQ